MVQDIMMLYSYFKFWYLNKLLQWWQNDLKRFSVGRLLKHIMVSVKAVQTLYKTNWKEVWKDVSTAK